MHISRCIYLLHHTFTHTNMEPISPRKKPLALGMSWIHPSQTSLWRPTLLCEGGSLWARVRAPLIWKVDFKMEIIRENQCHTVVYVWVWLCGHEYVWLCLSVSVCNGALTLTCISCSALSWFFFLKKIKLYFFSFPFSKTKQFTDAESFFRNNSQCIIQISFELSTWYAHHEYI